MARCEVKWAFSPLLDTYKGGFMQWNHQLPGIGCFVDTSLLYQYNFCDQLDFVLGIRFQYLATLNKAFVCVKKNKKGYILGTM